MLYIYMHIGTLLNNMSRVFLEEYLRMAMIMGMAICKWGSDGPTHAGHFVCFFLMANTCNHDISPHVFAFRSSVIYRWV